VVAAPDRWATQNCFWAEYLFIGHILNKQSEKRKKCNVDTVLFKGYFYLTKMFLEVDHGNQSGNDEEVLVRNVILTNQQLVAFLCF
jgi:hypothetical protein